MSRARARADEEYVDDLSRARIAREQAEELTAELAEQVAAGKRDVSGIGADDEIAHAPTTGPLIVIAHAVAHAGQLEKDAEQIKEKLLLGMTLTPGAAKLLVGAAQSAMHAAFAFAKLVDMVELPVAIGDILAEQEASEGRVVAESVDRCGITPMDRQCDRERGHGGNHHITVGGAR